MKMKTSFTFTCKIACIVRQVLYLKVRGVKKEGVFGFLITRNPVLLDKGTKPLTNNCDTSLINKFDLPIKYMKC